MRGFSAYQDPFPPRLTHDTLSTAARGRFVNIKSSSKSEDQTNKNHFFSCKRYNYSNWEKTYSMIGTHLTHSSQKKSSSLDHQPIKTLRNQDFLSITPQPDGSQQGQQSTPGDSWYPPNPASEGKCVQCLPESCRDSAASLAQSRDPERIPCTPRLCSQDLCVGRDPGCHGGFHFFPGFNPRR